MGPVRVGFFGQSGPYAPVALRRILDQPGPWQLVAVVEGQKGSPRTRLRRPMGAAQLPSGEDLASLALAAGLPCLETSDVNGTQALFEIAALQLDWIVCVGFDRLFSRDLLKLARRGAVNAHPSKLPQYRGPAPIFWARKHGVSEIAVTVHVLDVREDHGPVLAQEPLVMPALASGDTIFTLAGDLAGRMLVRLLTRIATGSFDARPQDHRRASRAPRPKPEDAYFDPREWGCAELADFASAAAFYRSAWMRSGDDVFFAREGVKAEPGRTIPGLYLLIGDTLLVQCKDGVAHLRIQV